MIRILAIIAVVIALAAASRFLEETGAPYGQGRDTLHVMFGAELGALAAFGLITLNPIVWHAPRGRRRMPPDSRGQSQSGLRAMNV